MRKNVVKVVGATSSEDFLVTLVNRASVLVREGNDASPEFQRDKIGDERLNNLIGLITQYVMKAEI